MSVQDTVSEVMAEMNVKDPQKVADRMRTLCSRREYSRGDILRKVSSALDGDRDEAERIVSKLEQEKYIDDLRYATAFARDKSSISGWGESKIRYMLSSKGISREVILQALENIDDSKASARLEKLMENKARALRDDPQAKMKMLRFGLGRGYSYEDVAEIVEVIIARWKDTEN